MIRVLESDEKGDKMVNLTRWITGLVFLLVIAVAGAQAQATRTWVSGVGDDANPCSRTAPCKTFAGAISKTAAGGEINAMDPGGYGAVTITKAITIDGGGTLAGILAGVSTSGVIVNAGANDVVVLRKLDINGNGNGSNGVKFLAGGSLVIEDSTIYGFTGAGIHFQPSGASFLSIDRTRVSKSAAGLLLRPDAAGSATVNVSNSRFVHNTFGMRAEDRSRITISDSTAANNGTNGFVALSTAAPAEINLERCVSANNGTNGILAQGAGATVRISHTAVADNATGISSVGGGDIESFGTNRIAGNTVNGVPTANINEQ